MKTSMKIKIGLAFIALLAGLFLTVVLLSKNNYESFLLDENLKISMLDKKFSEISSRPDKPELAAFQNYLMIVDPELKYVPVNRLQETYEKLKNKTGSIFKESNDIEWSSDGSNMGGRTRTLMFDPNDINKQKVWAGSVTGGLWFNNNIFDKNSSWTPVNDFWESLSISSITYDPNNTQVFYVGTGEAETAVTTYRESSGRGSGLWRSIDGGKNWEQIESTKDFAYITDIAVRDESGLSVLYVAAVSGNYQEENFQSTPTDGLFRSADNGQSWVQVLPNIPETDVPFAPSDIEIAGNGKILIGTMPNLNEKGGAYILMSTVGTTDSWSLYPNCQNLIKKKPSYNIPGRVELASSISDSNRIYAFIASGSLLTTLGTFKTYICEFILRSDDGGLNWTELPIPDIEMDATVNNWAYLAWHALAAQVDPNDANTLYIGGLDLFKSIDGGQNWHQISNWLGMYYDDIDNYVHGDQHCIKFQPGNSENIVFCTDGGVFLAENAIWDIPLLNERNKNLNTLQFYTAAINPNKNSRFYLGGTQDNGTLSTNGAPINISNLVQGGDGAFCFINSESNTITSHYYNRYLVNNNGEYKFIDAYSGTFISPADYNEKLDALYANAHMFDGEKSGEILRIKNIAGNYTRSFHSLNTGTSVPFSAIKISPTSTITNTVLFIGTQAGRLFKVENSQSAPSATEITDNNFPTANISCIDISSNGETILVTFSNYGINSVWISKDAGNSWESIENNLPDIPVRWALLHTSNPKQVMLATEVGIWSADDISIDNFEWKLTNNGLANVRVDMIRMRSVDETVLAATHGRGLFTAKFESNISSSTNNLADYNSKLVFPNPTLGLLRINNNPNDKITVKVYTISGKELASFENLQSNIIDISSYGKGMRILKVNNGKKIATTKVLVY